MHTINLTSHSDKQALTPEELGWEPGFFEATFGCLKDDPIVRPPQLPLETREARTLTQRSTK